MSRTLLFAALATLALAGCDSDASAPGGAPSGKALAPIAAPAGTEWRDKLTVTKYDGYQVGNPDAPLKLVEYGSLTCPTCARFGMEGMEPLLSDYVNKGTVSFELRNYAVHGTIDIVLARLVRCGAPEAVVPLSEQLWQQHEAIMAPVTANGERLEQAMTLPMNQRFAAFAQVAGFYDFFAQRGISPEQAQACLADIPAMEKLANETEQQGREFDVTGTPTFFLNGQKVEANGWSTLEPILQQAGAR